MIRLRNLSDQPLLLHRGKASPLNLLAGSTVVLEEDEAASPQVQTLVAAGLLEARPFAPRQNGSGERDRRTPGGRRESDNPQRADAKSKKVEG